MDLADENLQCREVRQMETVLLIKIALILVILGIPGLLWVAFLAADELAMLLSSMLHPRPR